MFQSCAKNIFSVFDSLTCKFADTLYHLPSRVKLAVDFPVNRSKLNKVFLCTNGTCSCCVCAMKA